MKLTDRRIWPILALAAVGLALLLLCGRTDDTAAQTLAWQSETEALEARIAALCAEVAGVSEVRVAVTVEPRTDRTSPPQLSGIGVVCRGGDSPETVERLVSLLSAAFGVSTNRIYITAAGA